MDRSDGGEKLNRRSVLAAGVALTAFAVGVPGTVFGQSEDALVRTKQGQLRGRRVGNAYEFLGVRYAEPQTAENRFKPPIPLKPWQGVRDALTVGPAALQRWGPAGFMVAWAIQPEVSEDCLRINVFTPAISDGKKRPVMFWCHGGGFTSGSGSCVAYDGKNLAVFGDVVVVTVSHRLNTFGYLHLADVAGGEFAGSGNVGMLDIIEALRWVRDNIPQFGGNPGNVTISGQSGGGSKVSTLMAMPAAAGLFHKAIVESGSTLRSQTREEASKTATALLAELGLSPGDAAKLRSVPAERLLDASVKIGGNFGPVVDGVYLPRNPFDPDAPPISRSVPMIIGNTADETAINASEEDFGITEAELRDRLVGEYGDKMLPVIAAYRAAEPALSPSRLLFRITSDFGMRINALTQAERKVQQGGAPAFVYFMAWETPIQGGRLGARHTIEVGFAFHNHKNELVQQYLGAGPEQDRLGDQIASAWVAFARTGNPSNPVTGNWAPYNPTSRPTMVFSSKTALINDPSAAELKVVREVIASGGPRPTGLSLPRGRGGPRLPS